MVTKTASTSGERLTKGQAKMWVARLGSAGDLTLPEAIRRAARLEDEEVLFVETVEDDPSGVRVRVYRIDAEDAWLYSPKWVAKVREAMDDVASGRVTSYDTADEFLASLE
jgi:bifunctional DNA-binding transcriptional regulator/antitoxin component of YhaV-PrlF toxin-antitoxin module